MSDRIREHSRRNHEQHGVARQSAANSFLKLLDEVDELRDALQEWRLNSTAENCAHVEAEVADCAIILDHILDMVTGRLLEGAIADKVLADRMKLARAAGGAR